MLLEIISWGGSLLVASAYTLRVFPEQIVLSKWVATIGSALLIMFGIASQQYFLVILYLNAMLWSLYGVKKWSDEKRGSQKRFKKHIHVCYGRTPKKRKKAYKGASKGKGG